MDVLGYEIPAYIIEIAAAMLVAFLIIALILYLYMSWATMVIARKTNTPGPKLAFVPVANVYLMAKMADLSGWYTTSLLLAFIPFIGGFITLATFAYIWWRIAKKLGRPGYWGILMLVPVVNLFILGNMAWGKIKQNESSYLSE